MKKKQRHVAKRIETSRRRKKSKELWCFQARDWHPHALRLITWEGAHVPDLDIVGRLVCPGGHQALALAELIRATSFWWTISPGWAKPWLCHYCCTQGTHGYHSASLDKSHAVQNRCKTPHVAIRNPVALTVVEQRWDIFSDSNMQKEKWVESTPFMSRSTEIAEKLRHR